MLCLRCQKVEVPSFIMSYTKLTAEESLEMGYCYPCVKIIRFENAKFVKCPYKIPINRKNV